MWTSISHLGDAALIVPLAAVCSAWLATSMHGWRITVSWLMLLGGGMLAVGLTKILYAGCGIEIQTIHFRVISGHTMLAASVWPMAFLLALHDGWHVRAHVALLPGSALAAAVATARVFDHAHTVSEVTTGWIIGTLVTVTLLRWKAAPVLLPWRRSPAAASMLAVSSIAYGYSSPIQAAIDTYSPFLCMPFR
ncbi:phosphatase PAP2 family protein [Burkholderia sp. Bp9031]|uniref:phosphatase PAP2 family protein n=1 Tax=Burkholderia sp. Bp9031 TaxID=2184566 RepID=UPI000F5D6E7A|nr:phosphatase PAP2 family protein [Burkholderia sp. Bp9031]RQZ09489.1 phosphatase PAP2 family protein [Burkholderia sp. Bp9031]